MVRVMTVNKKQYIVLFLQILLPLSCNTIFAIQTELKKTVSFKSIQSNAVSIELCKQTISELKV